MPDVPARDPGGADRTSDARTTERRGVVMLTTTFPVSPGDGTPEFVLTLAESLEGWDVTVVAPRVRGAANSSDIGGIRVVRTPYLPRRLETIATDAILPALRANPLRIFEVPLMLLGFLIGSLREIRRTKALVVNAHWILPAGAVAWVARRLLGVPYVLTVHGADAYALNAQPLKMIKATVLRGASAVAPVSSDIAARIGLSGVRTLPMGVDAEEIRRAVGTRLPQSGLLVMIGRLADKKGFDVAISALASAKGLRLQIIGDGPERESLGRLSVAEGVADRVEFMGKRPKSEVFAALGRAQAVLIPSRIGGGGDMEGTPVVLCEAMSAGVPVVASNLGGLGEHLRDGDTGILVTPGDVDELSHVLVEIEGDALDLEQIGKRGAEYAADHLDIGAIGASYRELLQLAGESGSP